MDEATACGSAVAARLSPGAVMRRGAAILTVIAATALTVGCATRDEAKAYQEYSEFMTKAGRFRQERAPVDAPFGPSDLVRNFKKVAFVPEKQLAAFYAKRQGERRLSKWARPFTYALLGDGVRETDHLSVDGIMRTLSDRMDLSIERATGAPDLAIFILSADARRQVAAGEAAKPWYDGSLFEDWVETLNPPCFALFDASTPAGGEIRSGAVFLKAEIENPLRGACLVEELTQSMGLIFDHEDVRPSIFNDDQEFISLTEHDEMLLEILYDRRLKPGMTQEVASPLVKRIVEEKTGARL
ncbi:MAG: DUF2927 domain-containing protein [Pseudomonadota bacterium]